MITRPPSDPDSWYDPEERAFAAIRKTIAAQEARIAELVAEIARLTAINADLLKTNLSHAEAIAELDAMTFDEPGAAIQRLTAERNKFAARIAELKAEVERLRNDGAGNRYWEGRWRDEKAERDTLEAERDRLKAALLAEREYAALFMDKTTAEIYLAHAPIRARPAP